MSAATMARNDDQFVVLLFFGVGFDCAIVFAVVL